MSTPEDHEHEQDEITARYDAMRARSDADTDQEGEEEDEDAEEEDAEEEDRIELEATVDGVYLYGTHPMARDRMKDQDLVDAIEDLMSEIPDGRPGQVVEVFDAKGKSRGTLVYGDDGWDADAIR